MVLEKRREEAFARANAMDALILAALKSNLLAEQTTNEIHDVERVGKNDGSKSRSPRS
ncbi:hypothetical protein ACVWXO_000389 [Bradyrhizobium sp. LM2.7]